MKLVKAIPMTYIGLVDQVCRTLFFRKLEKLEHGRLEVIEAYGESDRHLVFGDLTAPPELRASLRITDPQVYGRLVLGGTIGAGESYIDRDWDTQELTAVIRIFAANRALQLKMDSGLGAFAAPIQRLLHKLRSNSIRRARENIHAHYDLGNNFFELFLDSTWMYSAAVFESEAMTLEQAQLAKLDRICRKLDLKPGDKLIEIGSGWGGFALHAAKHYGCHVTTTTISEEQFKLAQARIAAEGLQDRITLLFQDYRLLEGQYDKLVSIEMIEAVGLEYLETYFEKCSSLLKPNGQALVQGITIRDESFERARKSVDFIQRYIFPGAGIPSIESILRASRRASDLQLVHLEDFGPDYARTLREWAIRLADNQAEMKARGYPDSLYRMWQYYFSYCEGGFLERSIGVGQFLFTKPEARPQSVLGQISKLS